MFTGFPDTGRIDQRQPDCADDEYAQNVHIRTKPHYDAQ